MARPYDVVVWGATGYTGRMVVNYLRDRTATDTLRWAVAGRSESKLRGLLPPDATNFIVASTDDPASLDAMCGATRLVVSCAGPFERIGMPTAEACVRQRTHYVDVTGEGVFVRRMIERLHTDAVREGLVMVPCSGFDCVPSDMINAYLHRLAAERGTTLKEVRSFFFLKGSKPSGGTLESMFNISGARELADKSPFSLNPPDMRRGAAPTRLGIRWNAALGTYTAPFIMSAINERVVRRSNALARREASYSEAIGGGLLAVIGATVLFYAMLLLTFRPVRAVLRRLAPAPGTGPSDQALQGASFRVEGFGTAADGTSLRARMSYDRNAYRATAIFAVETAAAVLDATDARADGGGAPRLGVLTPSIAGGEGLVERLRSAGFSLVSVP